MSLWLVDPHDQALHCNALWHRASSLLDTFTQTYQSPSLAQTAGLAGRAWKTGTAAFSQIF